MNIRSPLLLLSVSSVLALAGCGKELGRVPFAGPGSADTTVTLAAGDVDFWTDIDIDLKGNSGPLYTIELSQAGAPVATAQCNPMGHISVKTMWTETNMGDSHTRKGEGKMDCTVKLAKGGPTKIAVKVTYPVTPTSVTLKKADLVVKQ